MCKVTTAICIPKFCRFVNDVLQIRKSKQDIIWRMPVEGTDGESIILALSVGKLLLKVLERIEPMRSVEILVVFAVTAFYLAVVPGGIGLDKFVANAKLCKRFLK